MDVSGFSRIYTIVSRECSSDVVHILSLSLSSVGTSPVSNFNFFDEFVDFSLQKLRCRTLSVSIIFVIGLKKFSWLEMPRFFYTSIVCVRPHINRDFLNNIVIPGILILKQCGTDLRDDAANFWRLATRLSNFGTFSNLRGKSSVVLIFLSSLSAIANIILDLQRGSFFKWISDRLPSMCFRSVTMAEVSINSEFLGKVRRWIFPGRRSYGRMLLH